MNRTLILAFARQRLTSPIRLVLLLVSLGFPLLITLFMPAAGLQALGNAQNLALILGAGMIGQDLSTGVLQLLFARPVRRWEYVMSRWIAVGAGTAILSAFQTAMAVLILTQRGASPGWQPAALLAGENALLAFGLAAVIALFSTLVGGIGDLAIYLLAMMSGGILTMAGQAKGSMVASRIGEEVGRFLSPSIDLAQAIAHGPSWFGIASYLSTITLCLALAIVVIDRKELSYASSS